MYTLFYLFGHFHTYFSAPLDYGFISQYIDSLIYRFSAERSDIYFIISDTIPSD